MKRILRWGRVGTYFELVGSTQPQCFYYLMPYTDLGSRAYFGVLRRSCYIAVSIRYPSVDIKDEPELIGVVRNAT